MGGETRMAEEGSSLLPVREGIGRIVGALKKVEILSQEVRDRKIKALAVFDKERNGFGERATNGESKWNWFLASGLLGLHVRRARGGRGLGRA